MSEYEVRLTAEVGGREVRLLATVEVDGAHIPATWGPNGGDPEEWPDVDISQVVDEDTGTEIPLLSLDESTTEAIETKALEQHDERAFDGSDEDFDDVSYSDD